MLLDEFVASSGLVLANTKLICKVVLVVKELICRFWFSFGGDFC